MYLSHYGLEEAPFTITPVTEFFYDGANRGPTLEALIYAVVHVEGIIKVVGEVGSGKTMLCRVLMERLPDSVESIYLANPTLNKDELLLAVADELGLDAAGLRATQVMKAVQQALIDRHAEGKYVVVLVDEAHAMPQETLEELRLLSNLETSRHKLLRIVLFGQPELDDLLARPQMRQLRDRITHSFNMQPLALDNVREYLMFRMRAAGYKGPDIFSRGAIRSIAKASDGLSRRINILADKSLLAAFLDNTHEVGPRHVRSAVADSEFRPRARPLAWGALALVVALGVGAMTALWYFRTSPAEAPAAIQPQAVAPPPAATGPAGGTTPPATSPPASGAAANIPAKDDYPLLNQRTAAARDVMQHRPRSAYSVLLFLTNDAQPDRMERFLRDAQSSINLTDVYVHPSRLGDQANFAVLYGLFESSRAAEAAIAKLPAAYRSEFAPVVRTLGDIDTRR
jgi:type II secretory pathway predicted ATPase ExeA